MNGGIAITESAPACPAWRAISTATCVEEPLTPATTGTRPFVCSTTVSTTVLRSISVRVKNSLALTGATTPPAPATMQNSTQRRSDGRSRSPSGVNGVTGIAKIPRNDWVGLIACLSPRSAHRERSRGWKWSPGSEQMLLELGLVELDTQPWAIGHAEDTAFRPKRARQEHVADRIGC